MLIKSWISLCSKVAWENQEMKPLFGFERLSLWILLVTAGISKLILNKPLSCEGLFTDFSTGFFYRLFYRRVKLFVVYSSSKKSFEK